MRRWLPLWIALGSFAAGGTLGYLVGEAARPEPGPGATASPIPIPSPTAKSSPTRTATSIPTDTPAPSPTSTPSGTPTPAYTPTASLTPTITLTPTATPTYKPIAAIVLDQANCRYGPGAAYLYEYGLYPGVRVDIIGRNDLGDWAYVHPWTFFDRCWVRSDLLEIRGELFEAPPYYSRLPFGELYQPPTNVRASRNGDQVTIAWDPVWMTEDDYRGYLIEAWLCQDGQLLFTPLRSDETQVFVTDEAGCSEASGARLYTAEKHGYTQWVLVRWPAHDPTPTP
jgi:hypothetical protein